jgi:hypothetical protein
MQMTGTGKRVGLRFWVRPLLLDVLAGRASLGERPALPSAEAGG